ncbi:hypothetical protein [Curtobacterium sp. 260]|uniref:hypothetical protein n=1 Tax=Curtobacterium sp. 260 TaxID=2817748 RepID=UPI002786CFA3|nr:hypothetical protein [Curtobacterium sp. 260]MDP9736547.1 type I restriction enzyme S subunit [Curtobacterium sp. 260]
MSISRKTSVRIGQFFSARQSIDPRKHPDEVFDLLSIPAFDEGSPETIIGSDIGSTKLTVFPSDVLVSKIVPHIQRVWIVPPGGGRRQIASSEWIVLRSDVALPGYLRYALLDSRFHAQFMATVDGLGGSLQRARPQAVKQIEIDLPSIPRQRSVVEYLDRETAQIDVFIAKNLELINLLIERRDALIARTVLRGLDAAVELLASGVEWLGDVPSHWSIQRLASTVARARNGVWGADPEGDEDDLRCVRVADFDRSNQRIHDKVYTIRRLTASERAGRILRSGDLLLEKSGGGEKSPVGFVVLYDRAEPAVCSNFVARVQLREQMDPAFWTYVHGAMYRLRLTEKSLKQSTGIQNLDVKSYFNEFVAVPPYREQRAIAEHLDRAVAEIDTVIRAARQSVDLARERRAALISAAVIGEIDLGLAA